MFYFVIGDVIAKRDPLGLFSQSDYMGAEELYNAYEEKISRLTEEICRDDGWKKAHWTKILQALEAVFDSELDRDDGGQMPPALQKEMIETAREIQAAIFQSPAYYPELLQCSEEEKEECLKTVISLYRLWDCIRQQGGLALFVPNAPLLDACFYLPEYDIDGFLSIKKTFQQCMVTEGFSGGRLLNNAVAAEGTLLYLRFPEACSMSREEWGQKLCGTIKGLFGPDFENRVEACIEREAKMHISLNEEIPFEPLSIDWPKIENWELEEEKAAHIRFCAVEEALRESDNIPKWEAVKPETAEKIAQAAAQLRPQDSVLQMLKSLDGAGFYTYLLDVPKAALLEIPPYLSRQMQTEKKEKEELLQSVAKIFRMCFDMKDEETDSVFQKSLRRFWRDPQGGDGMPDVQKFRKENMKLVALACKDDEDFVEYRLLVEGIACMLENPGNVERLCCTMKVVLGLEYARQVDRILKDERKAYRKRKNRNEPSIVLEFDKLAKLSADQCAQMLKELPQNALVYAMKGAGDEVEDLLWRSLPEERRREVEEDLDIVVMVRLVDVEEAQRVILEKAKQMFGEKCLSDSGEDANV